MLLSQKVLTLFELMICISAQLLIASGHLAKLGLCIGVLLDFLECVVCIASFL